MDRVTNLIAIVKREVAEYAWDEEESRAYFMESQERQAYGVILVPVKKTYDAMVLMVARVTDDDMVIIERDITDKPLFDALLQAGVPRSRIIRAYRGETAPSL